VNAKLCVSGSISCEIRGAHYGFNAGDTIDFEGSPEEISELIEKSNGVISQVPPQPRAAVQGPRYRDPRWAHLEDEEFDRLFEAISEEHERRWFSEP
jgi:hypothetical protein